MTMIERAPVEVTQADMEMAYEILRLMDPRRPPNVPQVAALLAAHRIAAVADDTWKEIR